MCINRHMHVSVGTSQRPEGIGSLGAGVRNDCKRSIVGTGKQTYNSYESGMHSSPPRASTPPLWWSALTVNLTQPRVPGEDCLRWFVLWHACEDCLYKTPCCRKMQLAESGTTPWAWGPKLRSSREITLSTSKQASELTFIHFSWLLMWLNCLKFLSWIPWNDDLDLGAGIIPSSQKLHVVRMSYHRTETRLETPTGPKGLGCGGRGTSWLPETMCSHILPNDVSSWRYHRHMALLWLKHD